MGTDSSKGNIAFCLRRVCGTNLPSLAVLSLLVSLSACAPSQAPSDGQSDGGTDASRRSDARGDAGVEHVPEAGDARHADTPSEVVSGVDAGSDNDASSDSPCVPNCEGLCGPDGCGGSCGECDDDDPLTVDYCADSVCHYELLGCDDDNACTVDLVDDCACSHLVAPDEGCCAVTEDCEDGDPCTVHACDNFSCRTEVLPVESCKYWCDPGVEDSCVSEHPCQVASCDSTEHRCSYADKGAEQQAAEGIHCCSGDGDCMERGVWEEDGDGDGKPGPDRPETLDLCVNGLCKHVEIPSGCDCPEDGVCPADADPCTDEVCLGECVCASVVDADCCTSDEDCWDVTVMTADSCTDGICSSVDLDVESCDINSSCYPEWCCDDGNDCTHDRCLVTADQCYHVPVLYPPMCCLVDGDCADCNPCTVDKCVDFQCEHELVPGCS